MRRYGIWFVFILAFSAIFSKTVLASETQQIEIPSSAIVSKEGEEDTLKRLQQAKKNNGPKFYFRKKTKEEEELETEIITVQGKLSARGTNGVSIETHVDKKKGVSSDQWLQYREGMKISGVKKLADFHEGDIVEVTYKVAKDGSKRLMTGLKLVRRASPEPELTEEDSGALRSGEVQ
jgi:hypothetical protein